MTKTFGENPSVAAARLSHSIQFHGSRQQPSFYGLFVFIPNLPISVSPLSNFSDKNAASAGMSQCQQIKFFTKSPWGKRKAKQSFSRCDSKQVNSYLGNLFYTILSIVVNFRPFHPLLFIFIHFHQCSSISIVVSMVIIVFSILNCQNDASKVF